MQRSRKDAAQNVSSLVHALAVGALGLVLSLVSIGCQVTQEQPDEEIPGTLTVRITTVTFNCELTMKVSVQQTVDVPTPGTVRQVDIQSARLVNGQIDASDPSLSRIDLGKELTILVEFVFVGADCPSDLRTGGRKSFTGNLTDEGGGLYSIPWDSFR